jgi:tetratricopeptide (TPR) repeat protein
MVWEGVPSRNPNFTGRRELLRRLREELTSGVTAVLPQALHGSGGVGKTHLAIEYAHRYAADYDLVWWVPAEHQVPLRSSLAALARVLKVPESTDINRTLAAVREALTAGEPYRRWLLVFDNADEPGELRQYLPSGPGHTLVTSRNERWADEARGALKVDVFTRVESVQFLRQRGHAISAEDADRLATALGDLPLALEHAAALQAETEITVDEYLRRFTERQDQLIRTGSASDYPNTVVVTLGLAIEGLQMKAPAALQLLELCAFLAPEPVWFSLLLAGNWVTDLPPPLLAIVQDERKLKSAIVQIDRYGLARVDTAGKNLQVHRYVRELLLNRLTEGQRAGHRRSVHELLSVYNMVAGEPSDPDNWDHYARLYPHMLAADAIEGPDPKVRKVVLDMVRNLYSRGDYDSSRELARSAIDRWTETLGPDDEQTLIMSYHLGCTLRAAGNSAAAREINKRTLARLSQVCGEDDAYTLDTANSVGADLRLLGEFQDARALDQDTLTRSRREFGEVDPSTMRSANNLAVDLRLLGEFSAALQVDKDTLRGRRLLFPGPHPETMMSVNNLARDHYELGNYTEARAALEDALATPSQRLGEDHPAALLARLTYAMVLRKVGEYENAYDQAARTLRLYQRKFGDSTPDTYAAMVTLANAAREAGDPTRARELCAAAHDGLGQTLGLEHSLTLHAAVDLGVALRTLRRHEEARQIDEQALNILVRVGDADRPFTLAAAVGLANDLYLAEEYTQARRWSEDTVARSTRVRGNDHPYTLAATYNLAVDLRATGDSVGADRLLTETVRRFARSQLGGDGEPMAAVGSPRAECDIDLLPT